MHVPDGILPLPVTLGGYLVTAAIAGACVRKIEQRPDPRSAIPKAAMLTAGFFVASLVHIPLPPMSVHLTLSGLMGVVLGWFAFPAILVGLFLQAVMFGHGGLTTIGVNALILGVPALMAFFLFRLRGRWLPPSPHADAAFGFLCGAGAVALSVTLFAAILVAFMPAHLDAAIERGALLILVLAHLPLMAIEGAIVAVLVGFVRKTSPQLLGGL